MGGGILAFDAEPSKESWFPVRVGGPEQVAKHPDRTLFLCWPPYETSMARDCLDQYCGDVLIHVGEGPGGCTGDDVFWEQIENEWFPAKHIKIPQWEAIHDSLTIFTRCRPA